LYSYNADEGLELRIDSRTMPIHWYEDCNTNTVFFHPMSAKLEGGIGGKVFKQYKVSQFYDYFEEFDKDMTMADADDWKDYDNRGKMSVDNPIGELDDE